MTFSSLYRQFVWLIGEVTPWRLLQFNLQDFRLVYAETESERSHQSQLDRGSSIPGSMLSSSF